MSSWVAKVQRTVPGAVFFYPHEMRNPSPGRYVVEGPTGERADSGTSLEHAAVLFLSVFKHDREARSAATKMEG